MGAPGHHLRVTTIVHSLSYSILIHVCLFVCLFVALAEQSTEDMEPLSVGANYTQMDTGLKNWPSLTLYH